MWFIAGIVVGMLIAIIVYIAGVYVRVKYDPISRIEKMVESKTQDTTGLIIQPISDEQESIESFFEKGA